MSIKAMRRPWSGGLGPARRLLRGSPACRSRTTVGTTFVSPTVVPIQLTAARIDDASRPAGASRNHETRRLHAIAPGLVGQTIERAGGYKQDAGPPGRRQDLD